MRNVKSKITGPANLLVPNNRKQRRARQAEIRRFLKEERKGKGHA